MTTTRKQAPSSVETDDSSNNNKNKRRRLNDDSSIDDESSLERKMVAAARPEAAPVSFDSLNGDCLIDILSFLPVEDMNSLAVCSQRCREARNNDSLDQTRTGTILCSNQTTPTSLRETLTMADTALCANYEHLKIVLRAESLDYSYLPPPSRPLLHRVTRLDICLLFRTIGRIPESMHAGACKVLNSLSNRIFLPNVQELYVCGGSGGDYWYRVDSGLHDFCYAHPSVSRISLKDCDFVGDINARMHQVSELILDNCRLEKHDFHPLTLLFSSYPNLERLIMVNNTRLTYVNNDLSIGAFRPSETVTQSILTNLIRSYRSLRWFQSDMLSANSLAILRRQRPDIQFVID